MTVFPAMLIAAVAATLALLGAGWDPGVVVAVVSVAGAAIVAGLERVLPYRRDWNRSHGDLLTDGLHTLVSGIAVPELFRITALTGAVWLGGWLAARSPVPLWPSGTPWWVQLPLALVLTELPLYWSHRLAHEWPWLWRFHAPHHSAERVYWLNAARLHPIDSVLTYVAAMVPLALLGCPPETIALYTTFAGTHALMQHANIDLRHGPLNWVFATVQLHRWHHARPTVQANTNYGATLIWFDILFGTRSLPGPGPEEVGIEDMPSFPRGWWAHLAAPFRWKAVVEASRSPRR